jgi:recombination DNA repair RAD52 pathway protein
MSSIRTEQLQQLMKPLNATRIKTAPKVFGSFIETWDVIAHLSRIFGVDGWDKHVIESHLIAEEKLANGKWNVTYGATVRLTVRFADATVHHGYTIKVSEDVATGTAANQPNLGDAHDLALKTAVSDALKRAAKDLGNQFGLSLYNKGSAESVLGRSLAHPKLDPQSEPEEAE